jgi:hypothetical protein
MLRHNLLYVTAVALALTACEEELCPRGQRPPSQADKVTIEEGVWGETWYWENAFSLPNGTGCEIPATITPVSRTVLFFREITLAEWGPADRDHPGAGFVEPESLERLGITPIDSVASDELGFYEMVLPPGRYSLLIRDGRWLYAPWVPVNAQVGALGATYVRFDIYAESDRPEGAP